MIEYSSRLIRAAGYLLLAAALLIGIPWACVHFVGWPLPRAVPDAFTLRDWFDHPFSPSRFAKLASILGWLLWAVLVFFLCTEVLQRTGRIHMPRIRLATPVQGLAAGV